MKRRRLTDTTHPELDIVDFQVIGELRENPLHLLLLGTDGACYAYDMVNGDITELEPDDSWAVDVIETASVLTRDHLDLVAS